MKSKAEIVGTVKTFVTDLKTYWDKPRPGEYVSNKEFLYFILGSGGSNNAMNTGANLTFTASCLFVGAIYGLRMMDFAMLGIVNMVLNYLFQPITMIITDNLGRPPKKTMRLINWASLAFVVVGIACFFVPQTPFEGFMPALPQVIGTKFLVQVLTTYYNILVYRKLSPKFGKYRCWVVAGILPYMVVLMLLVLFPYNELSYNDKFWVMNLMFAVWTTFATCFAQSANVQNVITPNTNERTRIISIGSFISSLLPSIYNIIWPVAAAAAGGLTSIRTYRIVLPIMLFAMVPFTLFLAFGCKDRVIQEENHKPEINMRKGFKEVLRNKYLWITNVSSWITTFSTGAINIVNMLIIYAMRQDWFMGIMSTILGTAYTPGMLLSPWLIKKFGKKRLMLFCKYMTVVCSLLSVAGVYMNSLVIIVISQYLVTMLASVMSIVTPSMTADIWDYQQYISGERLDGCMGIFGYLASPVTTVAAMVVPTIYGMFGFTSDWNILFDGDIRNRIFIVTIVLTAVTGLLSAIPYHFYDMTEQRHEEMMDELRARAKVKNHEHAQPETADNITESV
ncbi:MAG TPA: MFS transporter [Candidatus Scubalenecus merdavium]|uniref:MFS transporter n=1 Tax=Candidatus Scybalenecus merdavium TaxID=2840939 RepID=A0A9D1SMZ6_9FIRM|nr:MFS transporter [Candidatus Scubalenecus merdavium]